MYIGYDKIREVKYPDRAHPTDAGLDFFCPEINDEFVEAFKAIGANNNAAVEKDYIYLEPGVNAVIPSGIKLEIPYGFMGMFANKSGVATKHKLLIGAQIIDTFYSGECHIDLHNVGFRGVKIYPGEKIAQLIIIPVVCAEPTLVDNLYSGMKLEKYREEGGFGSTNETTNKTTS